MSTLADDSVSGLGVPAICRRKVTATFGGGRLTSDGGVLLLAQAERATGIAGRLAGSSADPRDQSRIVRDLDDILRAQNLGSPAAMRMPTISIICDRIRALSWRR
jgi:hypothetical protein